MEEWLIKEIEEEIRRLEPIRHKSDGEGPHIFRNGASYSLRWVLSQLGTWEPIPPPSQVK